jgi:hypothetical protein
MDNEHAWVRIVLRDNVFKIFGTFFGGSPCAEALGDGEDVVVDGFGQTDNGERVFVLG